MFSVMIISRTSSRQHKIQIHHILGKIQTSQLLIALLHKIKQKTTFQKTNVIYQFSCSLGDCVSVNKKNISTYIGSTTFLLRRLTSYLTDLITIYNDAILSNDWQIMVGHRTVHCQSNYKNDRNFWKLFTSKDDNQS